MDCVTLSTLSSTWCELDPNTAYVVCISICPHFLIWYPYVPTSLYGNTAHCSGYGVAMGCYRLCIVPKNRYCDVTMTWPLLFHRIRADMSETPDNALTTWMHGDYRLSIDRFFVGFNAICSTFLRNNPICIEGRNCRFSRPTVLGYSINARAVGPRTPYRVGGLAGDFTRAWVSHSLVNHWIYNFKASLLLCWLYIFTG